ncbi:MAG: DUF362 domain-containing protein [Verrucomicrobia bacterium]|nr:DUF362 domain-containing protein [Verrucomicrobiota bacterium]
MFLAQAAAGVLMPWAGTLHGAAPAEAAAQPAPRAATGIARCKRYEFAEVRRALGGLLDELGGVRALVRNRHVTVKVNLVNTSAEDVAGVPLGLTVTVHPVVAMALGSLLTDYGARRVTYCDQLPFAALDEAAFLGYGFDLRRFNEVMDGRARFVNTRNRGAFGSYATVRVPGGGELASAWEVNRAYVDTDVLMSLGKLKSHVGAGITAGMKNLFGVPPSSLYGDDAKHGPSEDALDYRNATMHACTRKPFTSADHFTGRSVEGDHGFNVPRFIVDLNAAFPLALVVLDAISVIQTAEGWWLGSMVSVTRPGLLLAGLNPVCTDTVAAAVMGFDPEAGDRTPPFANGTNYLALARRRGLGENRLKLLDVAGLDVAAARFEYQPTYRRPRS